MRSPARDTRPQAPKSFGGGLLTFVALGLAGCGGTDTDARVQQYRQAEAHELVGKYNQAKMRGDILAMCVNGNQVAAAYRDAHDPGNADAWTTVAASDCRRARNLLAPGVKDPPTRHRGLSGRPRRVDSSR